MTSSFVIPTGGLFRQRGTPVPVHRRGAVDPVALSASRLDPTSVELDGTLEAQGSTLILSGTVTASWHGECRRCLGPTGGELSVELREVFQPDAVEGETYPLAQDHVDLEPAIREALTLALPLAPLCDDACAGPDPEGHPVGTEDDADDEDEAGGPPVDPRWAALGELRFD